MTVNEAIKQLLSKAKTTDMRGFSKFFGDISSVLFKQGEEHLLRKELMKLLGIKGKDVLSKDLWMYANDVNMTVYDKGKIAVEALSDKVFKRLGSLEKKIIEKLADFTQKLTSKNLYITIGEQPVSVSGPTGFRFSVPDTKDPIEYMFPYHPHLIPAYKKLADAGVPVQWIWAAHDWFHELAHSLGQSSEKKADTYAFRTVKKFFSNKYPNVKKIMLGGHMFNPDTKKETDRKDRLQKAHDSFIKKDTTVEGHMLKTLYEKDKTLAKKVEQVLAAVTRKEIYNKIDKDISSVEKKLKALQKFLNSTKRIEDPDALNEVRWELNAYKANLLAEVSKLVG